MKLTRRIVELLQTAKTVEVTFDPLRSILPWPESPTLAGGCDTWFWRVLRGLQQSAFSIDLRLLSAFGRFNALFCYVQDRTASSAAQDAAAACCLRLRTAEFC